MKVHIKICGITRLEDALYAEKLGASAVGFVFFRKSPRYINPEQARTISESLGPFIARVGVFVDEDPVIVHNIARTAHLTVLQFHGAESPDYISTFKGFGIIKGLRVGNDFDPKILSMYNKNTILLDTLVPDNYGGTGKTFDWGKVLICGNDYRIILAGGLNPSNVREALKIVKPWGVDVSSGVELSPVIKDHEKMKAFFNTVGMPL